VVVVGDNRPPCGLRVLAGARSCPRARFRSGRRRYRVAAVLAALERWQTPAPPCPGLFRSRGRRVGCGDRCPRR
jgi:hypothetical protein